MRPDTLQTRSLTFAFLFAPPRFVARGEASSVYDAVSAALRIDDFNFQYKPADPVGESGTAQESRGFRFRLARQEGRGQMVAELLNDDPDHMPHHLKLTATWPQDPDRAIRNFDAIAGAVFEELELGSIVLAEVRIRAQCAVAGDDAIAYLHNELLGVPKAWIRSLGTPERMASVSFEVGSSQPPEGRPLGNPRRKLVIEKLRDERGSLYIELVSTWPQLPDPAEGTSVVLDPSLIRSLTPHPSEYLAEARAFLDDRLAQLAKG